MRRRSAMLATMVLAGAVSMAGQQKEVKRLDGSSIQPSEIDATVTRLMKAAEVTGVDLAVFNQGNIAYLKAFGVRDKEKNLPLTVDSVMSAASFTKVAFAYMVIQLVDAGNAGPRQACLSVFAEAVARIPAVRGLGQG
jgi:CubicO group peptidase (beta-lactamase class C family)